MGIMTSPITHRIHGTDIFSLHLVDLYGKLVGKYTVRPMDPSWVMESHNQLITGAKETLEGNMFWVRVNPGKQRRANKKCNKDLTTKATCRWQIIQLDKVTPTCLNDFLPCRDVVLQWCFPAFSKAGVVYLMLATCRNVLILELGIL